MERKDFLKLITLSTGAVLVGGNFLIDACKNPRSKEITFSTSDIAFLDEVGETILPRTSTPGAKDAQIGEFMKIMVTDCYTHKDQQAFLNGIDQLNAKSKKQFGEQFVDLMKEQKTTLLQELDKEAKEFERMKGEREKDKRAEADKNPQKEYDFEPSHYFTMMKQLTLFGYFTSKPGMTEAMQYVPVPGKWIAVTDYKKGDKNWAL